MAAPAGNQYWKLRSKHGRDAIFTEPNVLLEAANEYFEITSNRYWYKEDFIKSGPEAGKIVKLKTQTPFTIQSLCMYLGVNSQYFNMFVDSLENMEDSEKRKDFYLIITHIKETISNQKLEGAMSGAFNPMIVARIEGLKEKQDITTNGETLGLSIHVTRDEAKQISEQLDNEL